MSKVTVMKKRVALPKPFYKIKSSEASQSFLEDISASQ